MLCRLYATDQELWIPELSLIQAHGGRGFKCDRALFLTRLHRNVYLDVAGLPPHKLLEYFPQLEKNADKILFGSDWPALRSIGQNVGAIRSLPLADDIKAKILGGNAARLLNRSVRPTTD